MKKFVFWSFIIAAAGLFLDRPVSAAVEIKIFSLKEDLSIGVEEGDENMMFGTVADVELDSEGNIYVFDWKNSRIQKFDERGHFLQSIAIKKGQGPEEVAMLAGVAVSPSGEILILDRGGNKVLVLNKEGQFLRLFKLDFQANDLGCIDGDRVVLMGLEADKIFHVFDAEGRRLASFGEPFAVPSHLSQYKDMPLLKRPLRFSCSRQGRIFIFNPHKFEIRVYKDGQFVKALEGKSNLFEPARIPQASKQQMAIIFPFLTVLEFEERLYVTVMRTGGEGANELLIYENDKQVGTLAVDGLPRAVDQEGRLYCAEEAEFPRVVRYLVKAK